LIPLGNLANQLSDQRFKASGLALNQAIYLVDVRMKRIGVPDFAGLRPFNR
jgi:hypothetical protein